MKTINQGKPTAFMLLFTLYSTSIFADIPEVESPAAGEQTGLFAFGSEWIKDLIAFGVPTVLSLVFMWMVWELWKKISEQREAKEPAWNGVLAFSGAAALYFVVATFISVVILAIYE